MSSTHRGNYSAKHPSDSRPLPAAAEAIGRESREGKLPCATAFSIARDLDVAPSEVGKAADLLGVSITRCQLGLFGYRPNRRIIKPAESVSEELRRSINAELAGGCLPCLSAWEIAHKYCIHKMAVSSACEAMGIKIKPCQLGSF